MAGRECAKSFSGVAYHHSSFWRFGQDGLAASEPERNGTESQVLPYGCLMNILNLSLSKATDPSPRDVHRESDFNMVNDHGV